MQNDESKVAIEYLKNLIAENEKLKHNFDLVYEVLKMKEAELAELQKNATVPPPIYNFVIN